jgi:hypothetical protein
MAADPAEPHTYTVTFRAGRYALAALFAALGLLLISTSSAPGAANAILPGLILLAGCAYVAYSTAITRLTLSARGLEYRSLGGGFSAEWGQARAIRRQRSRYGYRTFLFLDNGHRITLSEFGGDWRMQPLGQDLQTYAPRLFENNPALT